MRVAASQMLRLPNVLLGAVLLGMLLAANPVNAAFLTNRSSWDRLSSAQKEWYLAGFLDNSLQIIQQNDGPDYQALYEATAICTARELPRGADLLKLVEEGYAVGPQQWRLSPGIILMGQIATLCRQDIQEARRKRGLPALK